MSEEKELKFKRFADEKQEQVRQLVAYTTLMGLTAKDLISIGNKLERDRKNAELKHLWDIIDSYNIEATGKFHHGRNYKRNYISNFKLTYNGKVFHFEDATWDCVYVRAVGSNKKRKFIHLKEYDELDCMRVNVHIGRVILNIYHKDLDLDKI